jgi:hypothetical protein
MHDIDTRSKKKAAPTSADLKRERNNARRRLRRAERELSAAKADRDAASEQAAAAAARALKVLRDLKACLKDVSL